MVILENIDIDIVINKAILQNIDIDKISNRFKFGISNRANNSLRNLLLLGQQVTEIDWGSERSQIALKQPNQFVSDQQTHAWSPIVKKICNTNSKIKQRVQVNVQGGPEQRDQVSPSLRPDVHRRQLQLAAVSVVPTI